MIEIDFSIMWVVFGIVIGVLGGASALVFLYFWGGHVSFIEFTRTGARIQMNNIPVTFEIIGREKRIDSSASKSMRKLTTGLTILDPEEYGMCAEIMLVNREAKLPLLYAVYENHHTEELAPKDGIESYIADKVHDVSAALRICRQKYPQLTCDLIEGYVYRWIKKVVVPNLRRACFDRIAYYQQLLDRNDVSQPLKEMIAARQAEHRDYIGRIEELSARSGVRIQESGVRMQESGVRSQETGEEAGRSPSISS